MKDDNADVAKKVAECSVSNQSACAKLLVDHPECLPNCRFDLMDEDMKKRLVDFMIKFSNDDNDLHETISCLDKDYDLSSKINSVLDSWLNVIRSNPVLSDVVDWSRLEICRYEE